MASDLIPWSWTLTPSNPDQLATCPSARKALGTFAVTNAIVSAVSLLTGNRWVVEKLTCGLFGKPGSSSSWMYMWTVGVGSQLAANAGIAILIKHTSGFGDEFTIIDLMLFYTARPRLAWIILSFFGIYTTEVRKKAKARYEMYRGNKYRRGYHSYEIPQDNDYIEDQPWGNSAKTSVVAELVLSMISLSVYGRTAHFAATHGYYAISADIGSSAKLMYAGALLYLVAFSFSLLAMIPQVQILWGHRSFNEGRASMIPLLYVGGMILPWVASWLFWAGYLHLAGTSYCPPNLITQASLWVSSSAVGFFAGSAF